MILNQTPEGVEAAENACLGKDVFKYHLDDSDEMEDFIPKEAANFKKYIAWCGKHNSQCNSVLSIAISCGNENLAKKILHSFRPDPEIRLEKCEKKKGRSDDYYDVYAHYTNATIEGAQKKYDEAVKSGAFN